MVQPDNFIGLAEETRLIVPIGEWVLRTACAQTRKWHDMGFDDLSVAVNLSARQFEQQDIAQLVRQVLAETGLAARHLELELAESVLMSDSDVMLRVCSAPARRASGSQNLSRPDPDQWKGRPDEIPARVTIRVASLELSDATRIVALVLTGLRVARAPFMS